jgi:hypothetical protein
LSGDIAARYRLQALVKEGAYADGITLTGMSGSLALILERSQARSLPVASRAPRPATR